MSTTTPYAPITEIHIDDATLAVPRGFRVGDVCTRPGGNYRYIIRNRDGAAILARPTPCADEVPTLARLRALLDGAMEARA